MGSKQLISSSLRIRVFWFYLWFCKAIMHKVQLLMITLFNFYFPLRYFLFLWFYLLYFLKCVFVNFVNYKMILCMQNNNLLFLLSVSKRHYYMLCSVCYLFLNNIRRNFYYAYFVTTYPLFRGEWRAMCACLRSVFMKIFYFSLLPSPPFCRTLVHCFGIYLLVVTHFLH